MPWQSRTEGDAKRHGMRSDGVSLEVALSEAGRIRQRAIVMTRLCTAFGLLPLELGLGDGSEMRNSPSLAVIGGLALLTPITLVMVPRLRVAIGVATGGW